MSVAGTVLVEHASTILDRGLVALAGPNGCGKTELLRTLVGARRPDAGVVRVAGLDPARAAPRPLARALGYVPQRASDLATGSTVREEIATVGRATGVRVEVEATARRLGVERLLDRHPWSLSGGERERVAIAAALAHDPAVLVLDEPTCGLDADGRRRLLDAFDATRRLVVVATHDEDLLARADLVLEIRGRRLLASPEAAP